MVRKLMRQDDPLPVAKAFAAATGLLGFGISGGIAVGLILCGLALYPLIGPSAWDPFLGFVDDSNPSLLVTLFGLSTITVLLFVAALTEIKDRGESTILASSLFPRILFPSRRSCLFGRSSVKVSADCCAGSLLNTAFASYSLTSPVQNTLLVSVGLTSSARRFQ